MAEQESGDKAFEKFIDENTSNPSSNLPFILKGIKDKMDFIKTMYELSINCYRTFEYEDAFEKILLAYIVKLMENSERCLSQTDMVLLEYENADLDNLDEEPMTGDPNEEGGSNDIDPLKGLL